MPTYVTLIRYTDQSVQTFKDLPQRLEQTRQAGEAVGAKLIGYYLTMGQYDAIAISEAPDDHAIAKLALAAGGRGTSEPKHCAPSLRRKPRARGRPVALRSSGATL